MFGVGKSSGQVPLTRVGMVVGMFLSRVHAGVDIIARSCGDLGTPKMSITFTKVKWAGMGADGRIYILNGKENSA
ncbi:hypothetical protein R1flu_018118 [Riccia fluitans]|uniref:Uncharacterized protein n=1 Tax=Riccia fluitans TaxID=41844 RepID=A0ABD1ZF85_9MARC